MNNPKLRTVRDARGNIVVRRRKLDGQCHILEIEYCMSINGTRFPNFPIYIGRKLAAYENDTVLGVMLAHRGDELHPALALCGGSWPALLISVRPGPAQRRESGGS